MVEQVVEGDGLDEEVILLTRLIDPETGREQDELVELGPESERGVDGLVDIEFEPRDAIFLHEERYVRLKPGESLGSLEIIRFPYSDLESETVSMDENPYKVGYKGGHSYGNQIGAGTKLGRVIGMGLEETSLRFLPILSRKHCQIYREDDTVYLEDLGSRTGTWVNGERLRNGTSTDGRCTGRRELKDGDVIYLAPKLFSPHSRSQDFKVELVYHAPE